MKETIEVLILKNQQEIRSYAKSAGNASVKELLDELWQKIRSAKFCAGQPRSHSSTEAVNLARLAVTVAEGSDDEYLRAEAWSMMAYTLNANENYKESMTYYGKCIESFEKTGARDRAARTRL